MFRCALAFCRCCGSAPLAFVPPLVCLENPGHSNATAADNAGFSIVLGWTMKLVINRYSLDYSLSQLRDDLFGGFASAMVLLPLALAYGTMVEGLGPVAGIYCAIAVGFFAALFGGTRSQISGPTAPMTLALVSILNADIATVGSVFTIVVLAGLIQILMGAIRIGQFVNYVPSSIVSGFMTGIGVIIILVQVAPFVGAPIKVGEINQVIGSLPAAMKDANPQAIIVAVITLLVGIFWPEPLRKYLPAPLAAMIVGSISALLWLNQQPVIGDLSFDLPELRLPVVSPALAGYLVPAMTLALFGSLDSLMNARMADRRTRTQHSPNRELAAQGVGNIVTGFVGGLPGSANTATTVVNIQSRGGRIAGVFCALILLALALGLGQFAKNIPVAVLAGVMVKAGWDIIDWRVALPVHSILEERLLVMGVTVVLVVLADLATAIAAGLVISAMADARRRAGIELDGVVSTSLTDLGFSEPAAAGSGENLAARAVRITLRGYFSVASHRSLVGHVRDCIKDYDVILFDFADTIFLDDSAAIAMEQIIDSAMSKGKELVIMGLPTQVERNLRVRNALENVPQERIVPSFAEAEALIEDILKS